jgi:antitoxin HigA-1
MLITKRKPASVGEILTEEFMAPMGLTQGALAEAMGVQRKHVNELCNDRRNVTAATALILARVFGNSPDFWLNVQRRMDLWKVMHSRREMARIERAKHVMGQGEIEHIPVGAVVKGAGSRKIGAMQVTATASRKGRRKGLGGTR